MVNSYNDEDDVKRYLLGELSPEEKARVEERYLMEGNYFERLQDAEDELIHKYVLNGLAGRECELFEKHYLSIPLNREKVKRAQTLKAYLNQPREEPTPIEQPSIVALLVKTVTDFLTSKATGQEPVYAMKATGWKPAYAMVEEQQIKNIDLLAWFENDRKRLEAFQSRLVYWFGNQGVQQHEDCEDLAQITFLRVIEKLNREAEICTIPPEKYTLGVAKNILRESRKPIQFPTEPLDPETTLGPDSDDILEEIDRERERKCLGKCLQNLEPVERELIGLYALSSSHYTEELAQKFGCTPNALRLRIHRTIREQLAPCVKNCLNRRNN